MIRRSPGRYGWLSITAPITTAVAGSTELRVHLTGAARVAEFDVLRAAEAA
jgi:hypothetical protein